MLLVAGIATLRSSHDQDAKGSVATVRASGAKKVRVIKFGSKAKNAKSAKSAKVVKSVVDAGDKA